MRAIVLESYGGIEVLQCRDVPDPVPGPEEVVVDVVAAAVNRADTLQRQGQYPGPKMAHEVPGLEFSGVVAAVGERCAEARVGDAVMGIVGGGGYAEKLVIHERQLLAVPAGVDVRDAAAIPEVFLTAWDAMVLQGGLTTGRRALVHAGASGVGTAAIQLCRAIAAPVAVTASPGKLAACLALGADAAIARTPNDWAGEVRRWSGGRGVDCVLDPIGGDELDRNIDVLAPQGRIVQIGLMGGANASIALGKLLVKRASLIGTTLRMRPIEEKITVCRRFAREVLPLFASGALRPVIDSRYPLADVGAAHLAIEANATIGKILLDVR